MKQTYVALCMVLIAGCSSSDRDVPNPSSGAGAGGTSSGMGGAGDGAGTTSMGGAAGMQMSAGGSGGTDTSVGAAGMQASAAMADDITLRGCGMGALCGATTFSVVESMWSTVTNKATFECLFASLARGRSGLFTHVTGHRFTNGMKEATHRFLVTGEREVLYTRVSNTAIEANVMDSSAAGLRCKLKPPSYFEACLAALDADADEAVDTTPCNTGVSVGLELDDTLDWIESCEPASPVVCPTPVPSAQETLLACEVDEPCAETSASMIEGLRSSVDKAGFECVFSKLAAGTPGRYVHHTDSVFSNGSAGAEHTFIVEEDGTVLYSQVASQSGFIQDGPTDHARRCELKPASYFEDCLAKLASDETGTTDAWQCVFGAGDATTPSQMLWASGCEDVEELACP